MSILIKNAAYVICSADRIERDCDVLIEGDRIAGVGAFDPQPGQEVVDASGHAVIPGLINAHTHLYQNFLKGLNDGVPLVEWIREVLYPAADVIHQAHWHAHDESLGYYWTLLAALEMIKAGTTCCINMDMTMDAVFQAWHDIGFRGVGAVTLSDQWTPDRLRRDPQVSRDEAVGYVERWHDTPAGSPRLQAWLAPSTPYLCSPDLLAWTAEQRDALGVRVQIHVAETRYEIDTIHEEAGTTPLQYLDRFGLVDDRLTAVHCVHMTQADLDLLKERDVIPVYNPKSNMKLGSGIAPIVKMLEMGIPVALANDGCASNDLLDMFEEMRCASLLQKVALEDPSAISAADVFRMATENAAKASAVDAGLIEPGRLADLAIIDLYKPHLIPVHDIINSLVYCAKAEDVVTTIINGQIVMRDRKLTTMDEEEIMAKALEQGIIMRERSQQSVLYPTASKSATI